ncbi:HMA2 domain-containing protein [Effusibacillus pohliae]|uniref:HMA2 domain-containing protein n=1 Tax=Effusibacillus pohliae TaxID=232270 RepID=UPI00037A2842|nr:hypothetical protein [Effusibacillus pohliae]
MPGIHEKGRLVRALPGRVRVEVHGLRHNRQAESWILQRFRRLEGICKVSPCALTGRVLFVYDEQRITLQAILQHIRSFEAQMVQMQTAEREVAPAAQPAGVTSLPTASAVAKNEYVGERVPLGLALSVGGLGALAVKQLWIGGPSALARNPAAFYLSGLVSVVMGYPVFAQVVQQAVRNGKRSGSKPTIDPIFLSALVLALVRENLVVLCGLSLIQYLNWQRQQAAFEQDSKASPAWSCPEIRRYSEQAGIWGIALAAAAWAATRNPLTGLAVLLAANPRPATLPSDYAWRQAEVIARERGYQVPDRGSLLQLARTKTVLFEDTSLIFRQDDDSDIRCVSKRDQAEKIWCLAASLLKKSDHPWRQAVFRQAEASGRTVRTAFDVSVTEHGIKGKVNGLEVLLGDREFMRQNGVDCSEYDLEAKRLKKAGYLFQFLAKQEHNQRLCRGLLAGKMGGVTPEFADFVNRAANSKWQIGALHNSLQIDRETLLRKGIEPTWLACEGRRAAHDLHAMLRQGEHVLLVSGDAFGAKELANTMNIPSVSLEQLQDVVPAVEYARRIDQMVRQHLVVAKLWNVVGCLLAIPFGFSSFSINVLADAVFLLLLVRATRVSQLEVPVERAIGERHNLPRVEVAAAVETVDSAV